MTKKIYKSAISEAVHQSAQALHRTGVIDKTTLREFDEACLAPILAFGPRDIQKLREANKVSQPVFARYLNTSESTIEKWETGAKRPSGMAVKLLTIVQKHGLQLLA
jgi:putative transcriptional regulator